MKFTYGGIEIEIEGASYPVQRSKEKLQVSDRTAGGTLETEDLGIAITQRVLNFELLPRDDYEALFYFFDEVVNAGQHAFELEDERSVTTTVVFVDKKINFSETDFELYSGQLTVENSNA